MTIREDGLPVILVALVDVAAQARWAYGDNADWVAGRTLPDHEWRFHLSWRDGELTTADEQLGDGAITFEVGVTAQEVGEYIRTRLGARPCDSR